MKFHKLILLIALITTFTFSSCENEPIDPQALVEEPAPCQAPFSFSVSPLINENSVSITWDKSSGTGAYEVQYGIHGFELGTGATVNFTNASSLIGGLVSTVSYDFYIRTRCADGYFSNWVGPVVPGGIGVSNCTNPTNLTAVRTATDVTSATVSWSSGSDATSWQMQYGVSGFTLGTGAIVASSSPTLMIYGLLATGSYEVYVRSNCSSNQNSNWVGPVIIPPVGISGDNSFFALVDGTEFADIILNVNPNSLLYSLPSLYIIATDANNNVIEINISDDAVVGTQYFNTNDPTDKFRFVYFNPLPTELEINTDGSLTVTERTPTRIKGIFYFNAINAFTQTTQITSGTFDLAIPLKAMLRLASFLL